MFTYEELKVQTRKQLLALIKWNGFGTISKYSRKSDIIDFILESAYKDEIEEEHPVSVRIKRIKESNK